MKNVKLFTEQEVEELRKNPYTLKVNEKSITYTYEFKQFFVEQRKKNLTSTKIFRMAGYDVDVLGTSRVYCAAKAINREARSPEGLKAPRGRTRDEEIARLAKEDLTKKRTDAAIRTLQAEIVRLEAEVEFLKKISFLTKPRPQNDSQPSKEN